MKLHFQMAFSHPSTSCLLKLSNGVMKSPKRQEILSLVFNCLCKMEDQLFFSQNSDLNNALALSIDNDDNQMIFVGHRVYLCPS